MKKISLYLLTVFLVACSSSNRLDTLALSSLPSLSSLANDSDPKTAYSAECTQFDKIGNAVGNCDESAISEFFKSDYLKIEKQLNCKTLIEKPIPDLVGIAAVNLCAKGVEIIGQKVSDKDFAVAMTEYKFGDFALNYIAKADNDDYDGADRWKNTMKVVSTRIGAACKTGVSEACSTKKDLLETSEKLKSVVSKKLEDLGCDICDQISGLESSIASNQEELSHEKEILKQSGTVNVVLVHNATGGIINMKKKIKQLKLDYKVNTGQEFSRKRCTKCFVE